MNVSDKQLPDEVTFFDRVIDAILSALTLWGFLPEHKKH